MLPSAFSPIHTSSPARPTVIIIDMLHNTLRHDTYITAYLSDRDCNKVVADQVVVMEIRVIPTTSPGSCSAKNSGACRCAYPLHFSPTTEGHAFKNNYKLPYFALISSIHRPHSQVHCECNFIINLRNIFPQLSVPLIGVPMRK